MPLDSLFISIPVAISTPTVRYRSALPDVLEYLGIEAIPGATLWAYKEEQLALNKPSWFYRHHDLVAIALGCSLLIGIAGAYFLLQHDQVFGSIFCLMLCVGLLACSLLPLRGKAYWAERRAERKDIPEALLPIADRIKAHAPHTTLIIGELFRENVVIDPYLIVCYNGRRACLGIWNANGKIVCAATTKE